MDHDIVTTLGQIVMLDLAGSLPFLHLFIGFVHLDEIGSLVLT